MKYLEVIYGNRKPTNYPEKLVKYLSDKYFDKHTPVILDVGCGEGIFMQAFQKQGFLVSGVDKENCNFEETISVADNSVDIVFCKSVIEHIHNTDKFLSEIYRILTPKGKVIILTPSWEYNYRDFFNDYTHVKPFHRKGLQDALKIHNFKDVKVEYFYHLPWFWSRSYLLPVVKLLSLLRRWKWKDKEEYEHRIPIRFSQEVQLLGVGTKWE